MPRSLYCILHHLLFIINDILIRDIDVSTVRKVFIINYILIRDVDGSTVRKVLRRAVY